MKKNILLLVMLCAALAVESFAQCTYTGAPPSTAIKVVSTGASGDYHYRIQTYTGVTSWSQIDGVSYSSQTDFFPIGWYVQNISNLTTIKNAGATVVLSTWYDVCNRYASSLGLSYPYDYTEYEQALVSYFSDLRTIGLKAIVDITAFPRYIDNPAENPTFTSCAAQRLAQRFRGEPGIFSWYIGDEPEFHNTTNTALQQTATTFRTNDNTHPIYIAAVNVNSTFSYSHSTYDIFGTDPYVFSPGSDYNNIVALDRSFLGLQAQSTMKTVKNNSKWGGMLVVQGQDMAVGSRAISTDEMMYQTLSPLVHGSQGLLWWWHAISAPTSTWTSTALETNVHNAINLLTNKNNRKKSSLTEVLMSGENKTAKTHLSRITIDGDSSHTIWGSTVTINNETKLKDYYTYYHFNKMEAVANVYKLNSLGTAWQQTSLGLTASDPRYITALYAWNGNVYTGIDFGGMVKKVVSGGTSWSDMSSSLGGAINAFAHTPAGSLYTAQSNKFYAITGTTWNYISDIQATVGGSTIVAPNVSSMLCIGNDTVLVGTQGGYSGNSGIYRSSNGGATWELLTGSPLIRTEQESNREEVWSLARSSSGTVFAGCDGRLLKSTNRGTTWSVASKWQNGVSGTVPNYAIWSIECASNGQIYIGTGDGIYQSANGGTTWSRITGIPDRVNVWDLASDNTYLYAATDKGVYRHTLGGSSASSYNGASGDLYTRYNTSDLDVECRTITVANGYVYVGTREFPNSFANVNNNVSKLTGWNSAFAEDRQLFDYSVKKHNGSYYIFAVNDFRPTVNVNFVLDSVLDAGETVSHVSEIMFDGSEVQHNTSAFFTEGLPNGIPRVGFAASFGAYQARVFRIDVLKWSDISAINRECNGVAPNQDPCKTHAGGVTIADFDGDGRKDDFMVMWVPELTGDAVEPFRFKIGWNLQNPSPGIITFDASNSTATTNFYPSTGNCYGEISGVSTNVYGGDITSDNLHGWNYPNGYPMPEVFFMGIDPASSTYRTKIGWDIHSSILGQPVSQLLYTYYSNNFPTLGGQFTMPTPLPATGGGITTYYKQTDSLDSQGKAIPNSKPEVILGHLADEPTANFFHYTTSSNWYIPTNAWDPINYTAPTAGNTRHPQGSSPGWDTEGAGMDIGYLYPVPQGIIGITDKYQEMAFGAIDGSQEFRYVIHNFDPAIGELDGVWRPAMTLPIRPSWYNGTVKDAGIALGDIDGDGDDDMIIMAIAQSCAGESTSQIFIRVGINTLFNESFSYKKDAEAEVESQQPMTGETVTATLSNQPNPFSMTTMVSYSIDKPAQIELEIYSMLGEVVHRVDVGMQQAGTYQLPFNAGNLSNGVYICRLKANGIIVNSVKMMLAK
jgi:hypothetical protein